MTPLYLGIIGNPFWNHFFHGKGSLASGGPVVIMADSPKWIMHLFDIKALAVETTISSHKNRSSSTTESRHSPTPQKKVFSKLNFIIISIWKQNISLQYKYKDLNYAHPIAYHFFQKREMRVFFLLLVCWLPSLITAEEPALLGKCTFSKTSSCFAETGVGYMLIDAVLFLQSQFEGYKFCIIAKLYIQGYCNCVTFDKIALTMIDRKMYINSFFRFFSYLKFIGKGKLPWPLV